MPPSPGPAPSAYVYRCVDHSRLTNWIATQIAPRVERWLPDAWSANAVTLAGSALMLLLLVGVMVAPAPLRAQLGPLWTALLWAYCVLDHVDGQRARRRGTSSAWGEFLDHALDAGHGPMLVVALALVAGESVRPAVTATVLACVGLATLATWLEQKSRGETVLGRIGPVEAVLVSGLFLAGWISPAAAAWWREPLGAAGNFSRAELALAGGAAGALAAAAAALQRTPAITARLGVFAGAVAAVAVAGATGVPWWLGWLALAVATAESAARVLVSHLARRPWPWPDTAGAALLLAAAAWPSGRLILAALGIGWLGARLGQAWRTALHLQPVRSNELGAGK